MIANTLGAARVPPRFRFLFGDDGTDQVFRDWLDRDIQGARLSRLFRAYYQFRSLIPLPIRHLLQRYRRMETAPRWCYPDAFTTCLIRQIGSLADGITAIHPWPDGANFAFVLTHDIETAEGLRRVGQLADLEEELGFRSSWNFVPYKYPIDRGLNRELTDRGFEIGVHGYNHDGKLFASRAIFDRRVPAIQTALESFGAVGFRAPMVHRNLEWLQDLDIQYDASCFDADPFQAMPGGVGSVWPFIAGRFVELPYTLPQDHTLFITLNERDGRIWHDKLDCLAKMRAMALVITHPDYLDSQRRIDAYRQLLLKARDIAGVWQALPKDVADWWRARDRSTLQREPNGDWIIHGPAADRARAITLRSTGSFDASDQMDVVAINGNDEWPMLAVEWSNTTISGNV